MSDDDKGVFTDEDILEASKAFEDWPPIDPEEADLIGRIKARQEAAQLERQAAFEKLRAEEKRIMDDARWRIETVLRSFQIQARLTSDYDCCTFEARFPDGTQVAIADFEFDTFDDVPAKES